MLSKFREILHVNQQIYKNDLFSIFVIKYWKIILRDWIWGAIRLFAGLAIAGIIACLVFLVGITVLRLLFPAFFLAFITWLFFDNWWTGAGLGINSIYYLQNLHKRLELVFPFGYRA